MFLKQARGSGEHSRNTIFGTMSSTYWTSLDLSRNSLSTIQLSFTQPCVQRRGSRLLAAAACTEGRVRKHGSSSKREPIPRLEAKGSHCRYGYEGAVRCCSLLDGPITVALVPFVGRVSVCGPVAASGDTPLTCSVLCDGQGGEVQRIFLFTTPQVSNQRIMMPETTHFSVRNPQVL